MSLTRGMLQADLSDINMTPKEVVERLDKYIVGQVSLFVQLSMTVHSHHTVTTDTPFEGNS